MMRVVFTGTYDHSIDQKNRMSIPADIRTMLQRAIDPAKGEPLYMYVMLGEGHALCLYTEKGFEKRANELDHSELDPDELLTYERLLFSLAKRVELDRQGRILLPENLLKRAKLGQDVVLIGVKDHLEIRNRTDWIEHVEQMLIAKPNILMNPRKAMRKVAQYRDGTASN